MKQPIVTSHFACGDEEERKQKFNEIAREMVLAELKRQERDIFLCTKPTGMCYDNSMNRVGL